MPRIKKADKEISFKISEDIIICVGSGKIRTGPDQSKFVKGKKKVRVGGNSISNLIYLTQVGKKKDKKPVNIYVNEDVDGGLTIKFLINGIEVPGGVSIDPSDNECITIQTNIGGDKIIGYDVPLKPKR